MGRRGQGERVADPPTAGRLPRSRPRCASSAVLASKQEYALETSRFKAQGWTAYKIHPPADPQVDKGLMLAINDPGPGAAIDFDLIERRKVALAR